MMDKIILAGFGGQGIMFIGKVMAYSGMEGKLELCWIPSYGPEMRGGTANCSVILSDQEIYSPVIDYADCGIVMNGPAYEKFLPKIKPGGVLVVNASMVEIKSKPADIRLVEVPASHIAKELGNISIANMVCLGALLPHLQLMNQENAYQALKKLTLNKKQELMEINWKGIIKGLEYKES